MKLNPFTKKKKKPFDYKAVVFVPSVDSMQQQTSVEAKLNRDKEDNLLYLIDVKTEGKIFKEIFPGDNKKIYVNDELANLEKKLETLEKKRKEKSKDKTENYLNIEKEYVNLKQLISKLKEPRGSFTIQNSAGEKVIYFLRKSTGLSPVHFDIHSNQAYSPTESQSKDAFNAWKTKYENLKDNPSTGFEKITATITAVVLILLCLGLGVLFWNMFQHESDWEQMKIEQKYICEVSNKETLDKIYSTNEETSNILRDYTEKTFGIKEPEIQTPKVGEVK